MTALHLATQHGHEAMAHLLLEKGADIDAPDEYGRTALHLATQNEHEAVAKLLLERNDIDPDSMGENSRQRPRRDSQEWTWDGGAALSSACDDDRSSTQVVWQNTLDGQSPAELGTAPASIQNFYKESRRQNYNSAG